MGREDKHKKIITKKAAFTIITTLIEILSLIIVFLTLREMQIERTNAYLPNIVFEPVSYATMWMEEDIASYQETNQVSSLILDDISFQNGETHWSDTVFTPYLDYGSNCKNTYRLELPMLNIGVGTASDITITLKHEDIIKAIDDFNSNDTVDGTQCDLDLNVEDYLCENGSSDILTDEIIYADDSTSYNMIHSSVETLHYPFLLSENGNTQHYYLPEIYYSFIYGTILRCQQSFSIYGTFKIPDVPITLTYKDAQGITYEIPYKIHTYGSNYSATTVYTVSIEKA